MCVIRTPTRLRPPSFARCIFEYEYEDDYESDALFPLRGLRALLVNCIFSRAGPARPQKRLSVGKKSQKIEGWLRFLTTPPARMLGVTNEPRELKFPGSRREAVTWTGSGGEFINRT